MKSSSETFDVFEFKEEDEVGFSPPSKMKTPKFVDDGDYDPERMSSLNGDLLFNFSRHEHQQFIPSELGHDSVCNQLEPRILSTETDASMDEELNRAISESVSSDEADDVFADAYESSRSTSSYIPGDDVPLEGHESSPDGCFALLQQMESKNVALICPDYILYRGRLSTESLLIFSKENLKLKDLDTHGDQGMSRFEWEINDIIDIQSQWSKRLEIVMVKLRVLFKDAKDFSGFQQTLAFQLWSFKKVVPALRRLDWLQYPEFFYD